MEIIYKQYINYINIDDLYSLVKNLLQSEDDKTTLLIKMKRINNIYKSIKLRICELIRNKIIPDSVFFEEDRTFILNAINKEYPHFTFTKSGITALLNSNDEILQNLIKRYDKMLTDIYKSYIDLL